RLERPLALTKADMLSHAPISEKHLALGTITVGEACQAAVESSDNPAANLLLRSLGGPEALTAWLRSIGDGATRLDRTELELNTAVPGDPRDTTTPRAMVATMQRLLLGDGLPPASRELLLGWMKTAPSGVNRLRRALPAGWKAADKTGTGGKGSTNDVAVLWSPSGAPVLVAAYVTGTDAPLEVREAVLADVGALIAGELA
ncbi:MAG TPA: class A beta-lactamase, partial [Phenylobacterium sp.]